MRAGTEGGLKPGTRDRDTAASPGPGCGGRKADRKPMFSVITVCFNDRPNLKVTADSVLCQTFGDFEWIVVDGNSADGTRELLLRLVDARLSWTSEADTGLFDAMNKGMDRASGRYLVFMNSGDAFHRPDTLAQVAREIGGAAVEPAFVYGDSVDLRDGVESYKAARSHRLHWRGQFAKHQSMFFANTGLRYDLGYRVTADYAFIANVLGAIDDERRILRLHWPVCRFLLGGINETRRFRALREDFRIRRNELGLSAASCAALYLLHYAHTLSKRALQRMRRFTGSAGLPRHS